ncbi:hypothetical protein [Stigmatella erecta]|uniref:Uncharacterized protein n=1 Tax=Stigmatella erecta TaxID=83460 RepID=A0A1I0L5Z7_9BACT|nr:hypothetical protein [Stigmatella erecta]SEU35183.1 hypothetical protein SAMN05443639_12014 [Stigmatella erecta]
METTNPPRESPARAPRIDTASPPREPTVSSAEDIQQHSGYKAVQPPRRPAYWGVDRELSRRPGVPMMRPPEPWPHSRADIEPMDPARSAVFKHGRPNREWPPVFGTTCPPKGLSGLIRKWAASFPDHKPQHWLLKLLGDRVDSAEHRFQQLAPVVLPLAAVGLFGYVLRRGRVRSPPYLLAAHGRPAWLRR